MTEWGSPWVEELIPVPDVMGALRAFSGQPRVLLLESALQRAEVGRYSFLMADPWFDAKLPHATFGQDPFRGLKGELERVTEGAGVETLAGLPPFQGGAAGLLSYELGQAWERVHVPRRDEFQIPVLAAGLYDWVIAWDHAQQRAWIISQGFPERNAALRKRRAAARGAGVRQIVASIPTENSRSQTPRPPFGSAPMPVAQLAPQWPAPGPPGLTSNFTKEAYLAAVRRAIEYVHAGDIFQVNLSQRLLYPAAEPPLDLYARLRACNPAPFAGYFACDDWVVASASPERFVCLREGEVETRPIKGTRRRRSGPEADLFTRDELRESAKDQAENVMIVDLLRNDLSRVCAPGTIRVPHLCRVETYETVQHLVSEVRGTLRTGLSAWDLLPAVFPGGSITGAPKVRAMEIIAELEPTARGPYCGSFFYIGYDGAMDSSILIRTFTVRNGWMQCPVGGGIVAQSDPVTEYEETLHKAEGMLRAIATSHERGLAGSL